MKYHISEGNGLIEANTELKGQGSASMLLKRVLRGSLLLVGKQALSFIKEPSQQLTASHTLKTGI